MLEQVAGDELPEGDHTPENLIATGYYRLGPWDDEPADPKQDRYDQLDDIVTTTSEVFLGLTLGCARCHNHKFEPLTMHDYYRMVAIFEPLAAAGQRPHRADSSHRHAGTDRRPRDRQLDQGYFLHEPSSKPPVSRLLHRGQAASPGPEVGPGVPAVTRGLATPVPHAAGRRQHLAAPAHTGAMVDRPDQPPDGSRDRQPRLAIPFRCWSRADLERLRHNG